MARKLFAFSVIALFMYIASPLMIPIAMGGVLAVLLLPVLERLERLKFPSTLASAILTLGVTLVFLFPTALLVFFGAKAGVQQLHVLKEAPKDGGGWIESFFGAGPIQQLMRWITDLYPIGMQELIDAAQELSRSIALKLADLLGEMLTRLPGMAMALAVIIVSIYFFLVDGRKLILFIRRYSIFSVNQTDQLIHTMAGMCRSVVLASLVAGLSQAIVETIVCLAVGVPSAFLIGGLVFMGSFIPLIGSAPVTFGVAIQQLLNGNTNAGIVLTVAALVVSLMDNLIRPMFLKGSANLHPLLAFVAAFGGLQTLGFLGVFLGPIAAAMFIAIVQIIVQDRAVKGYK